MRAEGRGYIGDPQDGLHQCGPIGRGSAAHTIENRCIAELAEHLVDVIGGDRQLTEDIVQETFIAVFRALPQFRGDSRLSTWIDRIAVRGVFHFLRLCE